MQLENVAVMRGPNYWSVSHHQVIVMHLKLNCGITSEFKEKIINLFPELPETNNLQETLSEVIKTLKKRLHEPDDFHLVNVDKNDKATIIFSYAVEAVGKEIADLAFKIVRACLDGEEIDLHSALEHLKDIAQTEALGPSTGSIYNEAVKRGIPVLRLDNGSYVQLGYGSAQKRFEATITSATGSIAVDKAGNKELTKQLLTDAYIPVPAGVVIDAVEKLKEAVTKLGFPLVVKPLDGNQGKGATININSEDELHNAFLKAQAFSENVVIEKFINGDDYRALVINYRFVAAAKRKPASVKGNGRYTISELIEEANKDPRRGDGHCNVLTKITVDASTHKLLAEKNYTLQSVPPKGEEIFLRDTANLSTGGTAEDVTDDVHPFNLALFERIARVIGLDICGIDIMARSLREPITENGGAIIEVNAAPGFRMHLQPTSGKPRNVAAPVIDMLFPDNSNGRIPIIAITGTNGKTTTTRLAARMVQQHGYSTGFTTTDGIYLNNQLIHKGDCSGPSSARTVLKDPAVEFAVLETARGGLLRSGLGFDQCSCAVITNVAEDHIGLGGIHTLEEMAKVKSVVARSVMPGGYAVLNADDDLVYAMKDEVSSNVALFSTRADNVRIEKHCAEGGIAAIYEEGYIMIREGNRLIPIEAVENIPLAHNGRATFNIANILGASLAAWVSKISLPAIRCTLRSFRNSAEDTPGRMNEFRLENCTVLVDYAHNPHGIRALGDFINSVQASYRIGVITAVGDRRTEDIMAIGYESAQIFDEIIIRYDEDLRGRTELEIGSLLRSGIQKKDPAKKIHNCANECDALEYAVRIAPQDAYIVITVEHAEKVIAKLKELQASTQSTVKNIKMAV